jgi:hypothetical protein
MLTREPMDEVRGVQYVRDVRWDVAVEANTDMLVELGTLDLALGTRDKAVDRARG